MSHLQIDEHDMVPAKPSGQTSTFIERNSRELLLLAAFGVMALAAFLVQMLAGPLPSLIVIFMRFLEFTLALILGTLVQLVISREQFLREQKSTALGAYRRILDIKRAVGRLKKTVENLRLGTPLERRQDLDVVDAIADGLSETVDSSIGDWDDIIGHEVVVFNRLSALVSGLRIREVPRAEPGTEEEQRSSSAAKRAEIERLLPTLPPVLQSALEFEDEVIPREGRISFRALRHLRESIRSSGCIRVLVSGRGGMTLSDLAVIGPVGPFSYSLDYGMSHEYMSLAGDGLSGLVENPLEGIGVYYKDYQASLMAVLPTKGITSGHPIGRIGSVEIVGSTYDGPGPEQGTFYVRVPMTEEDFLQAVSRLGLPMP